MRGEALRDPPLERHHLAVHVGGIGGRGPEERERVEVGPLLPVTGVAGGLVVLPHVGAAFRIRRGVLEELLAEAHQVADGSRPALRGGDAGHRRLPLRRGGIGGRPVVDVPDARVAGDAVDVLRLDHLSVNELVHGAGTEGLQLVTASTGAGVGLLHEGPHLLPEPGALGLPLLRRRDGPAHLVDDVGEAHLRLEDDQLGPLPGALVARALVDDVAVGAGGRHAHGVGEVDAPPVGVGRRLHGVAGLGAELVRAGDLDPLVGGEEEADAQQRTDEEDSREASPPPASALAVPQRRQQVLDHGISLGPLARTAHRNRTRSPPLGPTLRGVPGESPG